MNYLASWLARTVFTCVRDWVCNSSIITLVLVLWHSIENCSSNNNNNDLLKNSLGGSSLLSLHYKDKMVKLINIWSLYNRDNLITNWEKNTKTKTAAK